MNERFDRLSLLSPLMRVMAMEFIAKLVEEGIQIKIVETWRTAERQQKLVEAGRSWTQHSKHMKTRTLADGSEIPAAEAIDLAPYEIWNYAGPDKLAWHSDHPQWEAMGPLGESVGLVWGGRWKHRDMPHWELPDG